MQSRARFRIRFSFPAGSSATWLTLVLALGFGPGPVLAADAALGQDAAKAIPIVDAHFHVVSWMDGRELLAHMDRNAILSAGGVGGDGTEAMSQLGNRFIRPTGMGRWRTLHRKLDAADFANPDTPAVRQALSAIEADLRDQGARAIGEIHVNALTSTREPSSQFKVRADTPTLKALLDLAAKYDRPLNIHAQWDPDTAQEVERLAASNRRARLVLSHCGSFTTASDVRGVFERNVNVACDLSARGVPPLQGRATSYAVFDERSIYWGWAKLIEDYPDRFVVGIDTVHSWDEYDAVVRAIRFGLLARLSPGAAEKVAYRNAQAWFGLP
jgi:predicted TIM-barrel fold metal-dependent hydrolase